MNLLQMTNPFDLTGGGTAPADTIPTPREELKALSTMSFDDLIQNLINTMVHFAISVVIAVAVFYIGKFIIRKLYNLTQSILLRRQVDRSLSTFILSLIRIVLYFILIVTVIGILGIETSSFLAIFASAGVAIGMALSGTLQNFAGGVLILLLKPYKIGDYIEAQGFAGTVTEIQIFNTIISTPDNKSIIIPNGGLSTGTINNWSREDYRRIQWTVSISYGDDVSVAREAILKMFDEDERIVKHYIEDDREERAEAAKEEVAATAPEEVPAEKRRGFIYRLFHRSHKRVQEKVMTWEEARAEKVKALIPKVDRQPTVTLGELGASSIDLTVRAWARTPDYWSVYYDINERIYNELPRLGLSFPFPQMDVHVVGNQPQA